MFLIVWTNGELVVLLRFCTMCTTPPSPVVVVVVVVAVIGVAVVTVEFDPLYYSFRSGFLCRSCSYSIIGCIIIGRTIIPTNLVYCD